MDDYQAHDTAILTKGLSSEKTQKFGIGLIFVKELLLVKTVPLVKMFILEIKLKLGIMYVYKIM